jgi:hypothetical protein
MNIRLRKASHLSASIPEARAVWSDIIDRGVQIIKEPLFTWVWPAWLDAVPDFRNYKYIWMNRDIGDQAHSLLKYQIRRGYEDRSLDSCYRYCEAMDNSIHALLSCVPNHLVVDFDDFVNLRKIEEINAFIGRDLDTSLVDTKQVSLYPVTSGSTKRLTREIHCGLPGEMDRSLVPGQVRAIFEEELRR